MNKAYSITPLGDACVLLQLGDQPDEATFRQVMATAAYLEVDAFPGFIECVPAYASIAVHYHPMTVWRSRSIEERDCRSLYETVCRRIQGVLQPLARGEAAAGIADSRTVTIPVCYGGLYGPDLEEVAAHCNRAVEEVVRLHSSAEYLVYMIGFAPGFPYLGGMPPEIGAPRRATPRTLIPAGSVGIAGGQTGVYPLPTPGGWQLIGRTPLRLFRPEGDRPSLLQAGDRVRFEPITEAEYKRLERREGSTVHGAREEGCP
ncbi:5-oxoprolinase subunit PxpB [Paenibacillus sp. PL2-23]|uniref:5-oxoprolinase subunit PxpB n=1 Tax=Paenibacillus sp. PL2-23 TaxID=2100729 RepID=UPI0030FB8EB5